MRLVAGFTPLERKVNTDTPSIIDSIFFSLTGVSVSQSRDMAS